jgi:hypothetical protein
LRSNATKAEKSEPQIALGDTEVTLKGEVPKCVTSRAGCTSLGGLIDFDGGPAGDVDVMW